MAKDDVAERTLIQQINEELLASIETLDAFDEQTIEKLRDLIQAGELKKSKKVMEAILPTREGDHEAPGTGD